MAVWTKTCEICGKEIEVKTIRQKYCYSCGVEKNKKHTAAWRLKYATAPERFCKSCGVPIEKHRSYCLPCGEKRKQEVLQLTVERKKERLKYEAQNKKSKFSNLQNMLSGIDIAKYAKKR